MNKKNINRLAVVLVGEFRTWKIASKYLFQFFEERANQVDYFFVTWNVSSQTGKLIGVTDNDVVEPFVKFKQNLIEHKILEPIGRHNSTFYNQAWLSKIGNLLKRKYEAKNNFFYDQVVETRPDVYFRRHDSLWTFCKDFEYEGGLSYQFDSALAGMPDVYVRTSSITSDVVADRYYYKKSKDVRNIINATHWEFNNHHLTLSEIFYKRKICPKSYINEMDYRLFVCVRPSFPEDLDLDSVDAIELDNMFISYVKTDRDFFYGPNSDLPIVNVDD